MRNLRLALLLAMTLSAVPASAAQRLHSEIFRVVRAFELTEDRSLLSPRATLELRDRPLGEPGRKRFWADVPGPGLGIIEEPHVRRMAIVGIWGDRATVDATTSVRRHYSRDESSVTFIVSDRLQLRKMGGRWLIASVARNVSPTRSGPR